MPPRRRWSRWPSGEVLRDVHRDLECEGPRRRALKLDSTLPLSTRSQPFPRARSRRQVWRRRQPSLLRSLVPPVPILRPLAPSVMPQATISAVRSTCLGLPRALERNHVCPLPRTDHRAEPLGGLAQRAVGEVRVALCRGNLGMPEQPADDFERQTRRHQMRGVGVAEIVQPHVFNPSRRASRFPGLANILEVVVRGIAGKDEADARNGLLLHLPWRRPGSSRR